MQRKWHLLLVTLFKDVATYVPSQSPSSSNKGPARMFKFVLLWIKS